MVLYRMSSVIEIEEDLKSGRVPAIVATSSLELGIDMGSIDLVVQIEATRSVTSALQRIGRAGHQAGEISKGIIFPKYRGDLAACAALTRLMLNGEVETTQYLRNPLDILAQQIVAMTSMETWKVNDLERVIRQSAPFADLTRGILKAFWKCFQADFHRMNLRTASAELFGTDIWKEIRARQGAKSVAITNGGTIPDRGLYGVFLAGADREKVELVNWMKRWFLKLVKEKHSCWGSPPGVLKIFHMIELLFLQRLESKAKCHFGKVKGMAAAWNSAKQSGRLTRELQKMPTSKAEEVID